MLVARVPYGRSSCVCVIKCLEREAKMKDQEAGSMTRKSGETSEILRRTFFYYCQTERHITTPPRSLPRADSSNHTLSAFPNLFHSHQHGRRRCRRWWQGSWPVSVLPMANAVGPQSLSASLASRWNEQWLTISNRWMGHWGNLGKTLA
jgi:hypothetical protein